MKGREIDVPSLKRVTFLGAWLVLSSVLLLPGSGNAQITMSDGGSTAVINTGNTGTLGMNNWSVSALGGQSQLNQEWFWYSVNGGDVQPINTLGGLTVSDNGYGSDGLNDVTVMFANPILSVSVEYLLSGNGVGSGSADVEKFIRIDNNSDSTLSNFSLFEYSNFDLFENNYNSASIIDYSEALQTTVIGGAIAATVVFPSANYAEAGLAGQTLDDVTSGTLNGSLSAGPGNVAWAMQWSTNLVAGAELDIQQDSGVSAPPITPITPEPSTLALLSLALAGFGLLRKV